METINSVYLKGRVVKVYNDNVKKYIKADIMCGKRKNKIIPAVYYYETLKQKERCMSIIKVGTFVSIRGYIAIYDSISNNNEDCVVILSYKPISYVSYTNSFAGLVTGVSNIHKNSIGKGICCNIHVKTDKSLTLPAIAFGHVVEKLNVMKVVRNEKIARGNISVNKYRRICLHVETLSTP